MMQSPKLNQVTKSPSLPAILLFVTIMDTTWRMFIPTIGCTFIGIFFDHLFNTKPLFTISMITVGGISSLFLIKLQIKKGQKS